MWGSLRLASINTCTCISANIKVVLYCQPFNIYIVSQIGLLSTGHFDADIYGGSGSRYEGYVSSIAARDLDEVRKYY